MAALIFSTRPLSLDFFVLDVVHLAYCLLLYFFPLEVEEFTMLSPNSLYAYRMAPPVRPSRSLEGLERVIPPNLQKTPFTPYTPTRSDLFLNKPLPAMPFDQPEPEAEYSGMWSDSDSDSTVDSIASPSEPRNSTESYPIFVSSGSDDFDLVDHPTPADPLDSIVAPQRLLPPRTDSFQSSSSALTSVSKDDVDVDDVEEIKNNKTKSDDAQYGRPSQWSQTRPGTNHYFREKKWDFFPELATPGALPATSSGRISPSLRNGKTRKKEGRLGLSKRGRWNSLDRPGMGLAQARESFKTYVHRTLLTRDSPDNKGKEPSQRPATAPGNEWNEAGSLHQRRGHNVKPLDSSSLDVNMNTQMRALSLHTMSTASTSDMPRSPRSPRQKQLAVPMSPYQKYGPAIWESPKKFKKRNNFLNSKQPAASRSASHLVYTNPTPPLSPPLKMQLQQNTRDAVRALQGGTNHMLFAFDGAKKKISESKDERRREQLKAQIKLVGPVNPHTCSQVDPWL